MQNSEVGPPKGEPADVPSSSSLPAGTKLLGLTNPSAELVEWCNRHTIASDAFASKLVVIGAVSAGKTSLCQRYCNSEFTGAYKATIGCDFLVQRFRVLDCDFTVTVWDTAGEERFQSLTSPFFRGASAVLLCFDLGDEASFRATRTWAEIARQSVGSEHITALVGTKSDAFHAVQRDQGERLARELGCTHYWETSAKDNIGVNDLFESIASVLFVTCANERMLEERKQGNGKDAAATDGQRSGAAQVKESQNVTVVDEKGTKRKGTKRC